MAAGHKPFEIRDNTKRGFQVGDKVTFEETELCEDSSSLSGWSHFDAVITYVCGYNQPMNQVVFGFRLVSN